MRTHVGDVGHKQRRKANYSGNCKITETGKMLIGIVLAAVSDFISNETVIVCTTSVTSRSPKEAAAVC